MRPTLLFLTFALLSRASLAAADNAELQDRRQRAATAFHDGILLLHANTKLELNSDGFREDPFFFYFTGLENVTGAVLAIDGKSGDSWLFFPDQTPFSRIIPPEFTPAPETAKRLGIQHAVPWSELQAFLARRAGGTTTIYYASGSYESQTLPANLAGSSDPKAPLWIAALSAKWPSFRLQDARRQLDSLLAVQSPAELASVRIAAGATVKAVFAGIEAVKPGVSQRSVEAAVENACWQAGARGSSFWPWAMAGDNAVFPRPFQSLARYDHVNATLSPGQLVRLDVGCEWDHYGGDLGRTVPVSGHYSDSQREVWNIFVAAYKAGVGTLREGATEIQVWEAWRAELVGHRGTAKSELAKRAIDRWAKRENVPYWELHTMNLDAGEVDGPLRAGTTIDFEPIADIDGQGLYLEDMFLVTKTGVELLTPGVPYTADEIEAAMR